MLPVVSVGGCMRWLLLFVSVTAWGIPIDLTYTVIGTGGFSQPITPISNQPFWWTDSTGGISGETLGPFGYNPAPSFPLSTWTGSLLRSNPFSLTDDDTLSIDVLQFKQHDRQVYNVGFGLLLEDSQLRAILFNRRSDGGRQVGDAVSPPGYLFPSPTPGVEMTLTAAGDPLHFGNMPVTLGGITYGPVGAPEYYCGSNAVPNNFCSTEIKSSYRPGLGIYELLFGQFTIVPTYPPSGMAVKSV